MMQFKNKSNLPPSPQSVYRNDSNTSATGKGSLKSPFKEGNSNEEHETTLQSIQDQNQNNNSFNLFTSPKKSKTIITNLGLSRNASYGRLNSVASVGSDNLSPGIENGGLFSKDQCHKLAKSIIQHYGKNHDGACETLEVAKWLVDCYRAMNKNFQPTATDIASYMHVIDRDRTGRISLDDLENFIAKTFYNPKRDTN